MMVSVKEVTTRINECSLTTSTSVFASSDLNSVMTVVNVSGDAVDNRF